MIQNEIDSLVDSGVLQKEDFEEAKKERDKESDNKYRLNELNAYGYGGYHDIYEFVKGLKDQIPIPDPVPEPTAKKKKKKNEQGK